jgi:hypothetical protein
MGKDKMRSENECENGEMEKDRAEVRHERD